METIKLALKLRDMKIKGKHLRAKDIVPGVTYGHNVKNRNVTVVYNEFAKAYKTAGESSLLDLEIEGDGVVKALIKDVQTAPLSGRFTHVDFYEVNLMEKLRAEIILNFIGESPAVKELGGSLIKSMSSVRVECLPNDLVHSIDVDVTALKTFDAMIHVSDLKVPTGITVLENPLEVVVTAEAPMTEEQFKAMEGPVAVDVTAIKTEGEVKKAADDAKKAEDAAATAEEKK